MLWGYTWQFGGSDWAPRGPRWPIYAPMAWMKWVEKKMGVIGDFRAQGKVFTYVKVDKENQVTLGVCMAVWEV